MIFISSRPFSIVNQIDDSRFFPTSESKKAIVQVVRNAGAHLQNDVVCSCIWVKFKVLECFSEKNYSYGTDTFCSESVSNAPAAGDSSGVFVCCSKKLSA